MRIIFAVLISAFAIYSLFNEAPKVSLAGVSLETKSQGKLEICKNYPGCIGVYLTPWCSSCRSMIPFINELRSANNSSLANIIVIIGSDSKNNLKDLSSKISGQTFLDTEGKFSELTNFSSVPRWFVINNQQEITKSFSLRWLPDGSPEQKVEYLLKEYADFLVK